MLHVGNSKFDTGARRRLWDRFQSPHTPKNMLKIIVLAPAGAMTLVVVKWAASAAPPERSSSRNAVGQKSIEKIVENYQT